MKIISNAVQHNLDWKVTKVLTHSSLMHVSSEFVDLRGQCVGLWWWQRREVDLIGLRILHLWRWWGLRRRRRCPQRHSFLTLCCPSPFHQALTFWSVFSTFFIYIIVITAGHVFTIASTKQGIFFPLATDDCCTTEKSVSSLKLKDFQKGLRQFSSLWLATLSSGINLHSGILFPNIWRGFMLYLCTFFIFI